MLNCHVWLLNIVKCGKYSPVKFANFVYFCRYAHHSVNILRYFTTKLDNFTKFRKLFPAVLSNLQVCLIGEWRIYV